MINLMLKCQCNLIVFNLNSIISFFRKEFAFVCFRSQEDKQRALETLNGYKWKGKVLKALAAKASADPLHKRRGEEQSGETKPKRQRTAVEGTIEKLHINEPIAIL